MKQQDKRTTFGRTMFNFTLHVSKFLMKHMWLYYILNYTWGIITTFAGWVALGFVRLFLRKRVVEHGKFGPCHYAKFGDNWGGLEMGVNFFLADNMGEEWTLHTKQHECGHTFQNAIFGPLAIFLIYIPSACRYWYDVFQAKKGNFLDDEWYDSIWFEGSATTIGGIYYEEKIK